MMPNPILLPAPYYFSPPFMRSLKKISFGSMVLIVAGVMIFGSSALQAFASNRNGNPFGNGTFFQNNGTFSAVIRGQNLSGTMLFSTGYSQSTNGGTNSDSSGSCVISYLGSDPQDTNNFVLPGLYHGNAAGMWDPSSGTISGQLWGSYKMSGTNSATNWPEIYNTNQFPVIIPIVTNVILTNTVIDAVTGNTNYITTNVIVTNTLAVEPLGSNNFNDSAMMNGSFDGSVQNSYPNQTFSAQGTIMQQQLYPPQQGLNAYTTNADGSTNYNQEGSLPVQMSAPLRIPISVTGLRISDAYSTFNTVSNNVPWAFTTYTATNIPSKSGGLGGQ
jgi:hypothetical protein